MSVKKAEERVLCATNQIKNAEEELARAKVELALAQVTPAALKTLKALKETSHLVWEICNLKDWDDESKALYEKAESFEDELALALLGAGPRLEKLNKLDPVRWPLAGELRIRAGDFPTDEGVAHDIATMIFDHGFGRGSNKAYEELAPGEQTRWRDLKAKAEEIFGEIGTEGFELWRKGRHGT